MSEVSYTIPEVFKATFGVPYILPHQPPQSKINYNTPELVEEVTPSAQHGTSALGTLIHDVIELTDSKNNKWQMPDVVLFDLSQSKNIVYTQIQGKDGEVLEYISTNNFRITFRILFVNNGKSDPPDDAVKAMVNSWKKNEQLNVSSSALNDVFSIYSIVLTDSEWMQAEGTLNSIGLRLSAVSDTPIELQLLQLNQLG